MRRAWDGSAASLGGWVDHWAGDPTLRDKLSTGVISSSQRLRRLGDYV